MDLVATSFLTGTGGGSDLDPNLDLDSLFDFGGVDSAESSSESSSSMGRVGCFAFR